MSEGNRVWLQHGDDGCPECEIDSYCFERIHDNDVEYWRPEVVAKIALDHLAKVEKELLGPGSNFSQMDSILVGCIRADLLDEYCKAGIEVSDE